MSDEPDDDTKTGTRHKMASDMPVDLAKERETFVRSFLKKGVELTEQLLEEREELRQENQRLRDDVARLRAQVASDDALRDFMKTIEGLEAEKRRLLQRSSELERSRRTETARIDDIETELNDLANLYIAAFQLHASLSPRRVIRHVKDMLGQLVGAQGFAIYLVSDDGKRAEPIAHDSLSTAPPTVTVGDGVIGEACLTGLSRISEGKTKGTLRDPVAVVPMLVEGRPVGAIVIVSLLAQKTGWASLDLELFKLIGAHAGTALIAANLYEPEDGPLDALAGVKEKLEKRGPSLAPSGTGSSHE